MWTIYVKCYWNCYLDEKTTETVCFVIHITYCFLKTTNLCPTNFRFTEKLYNCLVSIYPLPSFPECYHLTQPQYNYQNRKFALCDTAELKTGLIWIAPGFLFLSFSNPRKLWCTEWFLLSLLQSVNSFTDFPGLSWYWQKSPDQLLWNVPQFGVSWCHPRIGMKFCTLGKKTREVMLRPF